MGASPAPASPDLDSLAQAIGNLQEALEAAVRKRLVSDVPVGVFLSGGLDSSLIAAIARRHVEGELHSFAVGLKGSLDVEYSRRVARELGTIHHVYEYDAAEAERVLPEAIRRLESCDPALVRSAVPTYLVSRLAREYVTVVLTGDGADEIFAGYDYLARVAQEASLAGVQRELATLTQALHFTNLQRVDRMTMAWSLEARVPFLDKEVVRYAFSLPPEWKWHPTASKWILRKLAEAYLPKEVVWRPKAKFSQGTGTVAVLRRAVQKQGIAEDEWYRRLLLRWLPGSALRTVGRTRSVTAGEV